jgi:hypothetical protein
MVASPPETDLCAFFVQTVTTILLNYSLDSMSRWASTIWASVERLSIIGVSTLLQPREDEAQGPRLAFGIPDDFAQQIAVPRQSLAAQLHDRNLESRAADFSGFRFWRGLPETRGEL